MRVLLLAGGAGTRLWPLSTEARPKQFLRLLSSKSLIAETYERVQPLSEEVYVATAQEHVQLVRRELPRLPASRILSEPSRRNSGPAVLSAALQFEEEGDALTAAVPSDQTAADGEAFRRALLAAGRTAESASVVVLAVPAARPETDYGYLELGSETAGEGTDVARFVEKPGPEEADRYVQAGYFWNAGIFVFRPSRLLTEARRVAGDLVRGVETYRKAQKSGRSDLAKRAYAALPAISFDYAVMEKASKVRAVPLRAGWSDVGTWRSVRDLRGPSDDHGNLILSDRPVLAPGVRHAAIVDSDNGLLVLPFEHEGELRAAVEKLRGSPAAPTEGRSARKPSRGESSPRRKS
ncbi:MAG TPA: mannose-1-phosphate guanylyltransferase [Thermoanaerobaculia bacterium]